MKIPIIWVITATLLALHALGFIDWSAWIIAGPVLVLIGVIVIAVAFPVVIGLYRGWKIRIVHGKGTGARKA
jgi:hypothetical protein